MTETTKLSQTERTFAGLRESLFEEFDKIRNGLTTPQVANATARMSSEIVKTTVAEIDLAKLRMRMTDAQKKGKNLPKLITSNNLGSEG